MYRRTKLCDWVELDMAELSGEMLARNASWLAIGLLAAQLAADPNPRQKNRETGMLYHSLLPEICENLAANPHPAALALLATLLPRQMELASPCVFDANCRKNSLRSLARRGAADAVALLARFPDHIPPELSDSSSPAAMELLRAHPNRADWQRVSMNPSPAAATLMAAHPERIEWDFLPRNRGEHVLSLLRENAHRFDEDDWWCMTGNPTIFEEVYDYAAMRAAMDPHREALAAAAFHPRRLARHLAAGGAPEEF